MAIVGKAVRLSSAAPLLSSYFRQAPHGSATTVSYRRSPTFNSFISTGRDSGALALLRDIVMPVWSHGNVQHLGQNLEKAFDQQGRQKNEAIRSVQIIGHGNHGFVDAGDGAWNDTDGGSIQLRNEWVWAPIFEKLRAPAFLYMRADPKLPPIPMYRGVNFLSCSTAGGDGRLLMQRIADIGGLAVHAYTGLVFVNRLYYFLEPGAKAACCIPSDASAVSREHYRPDSNWEEPLLPSLHGLAGHDFVAAALADGGFAQSLHVVASSWHGLGETHISGVNAERVLAKVFSVGPYRKDGEIIGSHSLTLVVERQGEAPLTIQVVGNRIAVTSEGLAFFVDHGLKAELLSLGVEY